MRRPIGYVVLTFPLISESFIENEIRAVREQGVDLFVVSMQHPLPGREAETVLPADRLTYRPSRSVRAAATVRWTVRRPRATFANVWSALRQRSETMMRACVDAAWVASEFEKAGVGQLHAHFATEPAAVAMAAARLLDVPFTFTAHAVDLYMRTTGLCAKAAGAARVVTVCEYNVEQLLQKCSALDRNSISIVYCGVDTQEFALRDATEPGPEIRVLSVGRLVPKKGYRDLIAAVALLRTRGMNVVLDIIGEGGQRAELEALIDELDLAGAVRLLGLRPNEEVRAALVMTDVFALACVVDDEANRDSMPVVIKEAMAVGVPVVATDEVGNPEMVDDEVGRLVPPADPAALAGAIAELATLAPDERRSIGLAARRRAVERFELRSEVAKLIDIFDGVVAARTGRLSRGRASPE